MTTGLDVVGIEAIILEFVWKLERHPGGLTN